jgi:hypothetical protein
VPHTKPLSACEWISSSTRNRAQMNASVVGKHNAAYFFRDFTFSTNTFKPNPDSELELWTL